MRLPLLRGLAPLLLPTALWAQTIPVQEYAARRDSLAARIDSGVVVAFGARNPVGFARPAQLPAFRYLTGFLEPDAAFVMVVRGGKARGTLFTESRDPRRALYDGFPPDSSAIARQVGLAARSLPALAPMLDSLAARGLPFYALRDFESSDYASQDSLTRGASFVRSFSASHGGLEWHNAHPILDSLRTRKSPAELAMLRRAIAITVEGLKEAMREIRPGMWEYEVEALLEAAFRRTGGDGPAFVSIIGSGPNSTQYHYNANNRRMLAGETVVMDVGAGYGGYAADVTRTVPVSGRFTPEQGAVYQIVRHAQAAAERTVKPGSTYEAWREAARVVVARGVARLGLTEGMDATFDPPWADQCEAN
ncbi:MAG: aminopeptidase P family protein, partial [Gemmatimonadales bacterium]|nr:aminopeptidase P family protein [Gemmatimonadales bacterium]